MFGVNDQVRRQAQGICVFVGDIIQVSHAVVPAAPNPAALVVYHGH